MFRSPFAAIYKKIHEIRNGRTYNPSPFLQEAASSPPLSVEVLLVFRHQEMPSGTSFVKSLDIHSSIESIYPEFP